MVSGKGLHSSQCCLSSLVIANTCIDLQTFSPHVLTVDSLERVNFASISWSFWCSHPGAVQQNNFYNLVGGRLFKAQQLRSCLINSVCVCWTWLFLCWAFNSCKIPSLLGRAPDIPSPARQGGAPPCGHTPWVDWEFILGEPKLHVQPCGVPLHPHAGWMWWEHSGDYVWKALFEFTSISLHFESISCWGLSVVVSILTLDL